MSMRDDDPEIIKELQGPMLNIGSPQSSLAPAILDMVKDIVLKDHAYIERVKTHYRIYRSKVERITNAKRRRRKIKLRR